MAEPLAFEKALEKLEKIVNDLESGDISLEDALKKYEEGVKLSRACQTKLSQAEKKIEILSKSLSGEITSASFDEETLEEKPGKADTRKQKSPCSSDKTGDEELLL